MYDRILKKPCYLLIVNTSGSLKKFLFFAGWQLSLCGSLLKSADGKQLSIVKVTAKILLLQLISVRMFLCSLIYIFSMENKDQGMLWQKYRSLLPYIQREIAGRTIKLLIDTGASKNYIQPLLYTIINL